ncbi:MAG: DEAD/DEAH box helicase [Metamycoplasmataceae bacterium]
MINDINKRFLDAKLNNREMLFNNDEIKYIESFRFYSEDHEEKDKLLFFICNIKNNLPIETKNNVKNIFSKFYNFFGDDDIQNETIRGIPIYKLKEKSLKIKDKTLTTSQEFVWNSLKQHNIALSAPTGFGKSFILSNFIMEMYENYKEFKHVLIVPTELLEEQLVSKLQNSYENYKNTIGNDFYINQIIICTPEKFFTILEDELINIKTLVFDEAYFLFSEEDERSKFAKYIFLEFIKKNSSKIKDIKIFLISVNLEKDKIEELNNNHKNLDIKFIKINSISKNNKHYEGINFSSFDKNNIYNFEGITGIYANSEMNIIRIIKDIKKDSLFLENINKYHKENFSDEKIKEIDKKIEEIIKIYKEYDILKYLKNGFGYIHSNMPNSVKRLIIELIEERYVKVLVCSPVIIFGIDLPFDNMLIENIKHGYNKIHLNDLINLIGRTGRVNNIKKKSSFGFAYLNIKNNENKIWHEENKEKINELLKSKKYLKIEKIKQEENKFIDLSIEMFNKTSELKYLIDPRINYLTTEKVVKYSISKDYDNIFENLVLNNKNYQQNKIEIKKIIYCLFIFYNCNEYSNHYKVNIYEGLTDIPFYEIYNNISINELGGTQLNHLLKFVKCSFNVEETIRVHARDLFKMCKLNNDFDNYSNNLEKAIKNIKTLGNYLLSMFLNHFSSLHNSEKYSSFHDFNIFKIPSKTLVKIIKENNLSEEWLVFINNETKEKKKIIEILKSINLNNNTNDKEWLFNINKTELSKFSSHQLLKKIHDLILKEEEKYNK